MTIAIREAKNGWRFKVVVQPRASRSMIVGQHGDALKIKLTAPPVEGAANKMCVALLADCLKIPRSWIRIAAGRHSRVKTIHVECSIEPPDKGRRGRLKRSIAALVDSDPSK